MKSDAFLVQIIGMALFAVGVMCLILITADTAGYRDYSDTELAILYFFWAAGWSVAVFVESDNKPDVPARTLFRRGLRILGCVLLFAFAFFSSITELIWE
jgi:hypothetical protein